jgi:acetyl esterase/lipase
MTVEQRCLLWQGEPPGSPIHDDFRPWLEFYPSATDGLRGAVIVCAGGGYNMRAEHEGEVVARRYQQAGFHAFLLQYRVAPHLPSAAFLDAAQCVRLIRARADEWKVAPNCLAMCGFSAGGHLAAMLGVYFEAGDDHAQEPLHHFSTRPDALILCYPYITAFAPRELVFDVVKKPSEEWRREISVDLHVKAKTPPTFLMHTYEDEAVPVEHSLRFANALARHGVSLELHIYAKGRHGQGLAEDNPYLATWFDLSCRWLRTLGWPQ